MWFNFELKCFGLAFSYIIWQFFFPGLVSNLFQTRLINFQACSGLVILRK